MIHVRISTADQSFDDQNDGNVSLDKTQTEVSREHDSENLLEHSATNKNGLGSISHEKHFNDTAAGTPEEIDPEIDEEDDNVITVDENAAPDGGWGWFIVIGALLLRTVIGGLGRSHGLFYLKFKERFHGTATTTALVTSLTGFVRLGAGPLVSILTGRFQCRILTSVGTMSLFLGVILTGFSPNLQFLYFSYGVVSGLGRALTLTPVPILLGYYFNKRRSLAYGLASAGFSIGGFAITPIVELLFQNYGYQGTFLILSGFALNILVASALFRPIELHRKLTSSNRKTRKLEDEAEVNSLIFKSLEHIESGAVLSSSTVSIHRLNIKSNDVKSSSTLSLKLSSSQGCSSITETVKDHKTEETSYTIKYNNRSNSDISNVSNTAKSKDTPKLTVNDTKDCLFDVKTSEEEEQKETLLQANDSEMSDCAENGEKRQSNCKWCCCKMKIGNESENSEIKKKSKTKLISWSVLKDTRFQCFVFATFCFTLPSSGLFLPALAKSKGVSDIQAATLLSISAGCDTVFRVLSGFVLDLKMFRSVRPQIFNGFTFLQGIVAGLFPLMTSYSEFMTLSAIDGAVQGVKNAQGTVVMLDILGVDKLASSLAITMAIQCVAVVLGPTISGQLIDRYGSYNGAFYFGSGAVLIGGIVMAGGNIAKHCRDRKSLDNRDDSDDR